MKKLWDNVMVNDVKKAIELFDSKNEDYPEPRNTFLVYNDKIYPAKHIRGIAYFVANKKEIAKSEYSGGEETANFFKNLGFTVQYKKETLKSSETPKKVQDPKVSREQGVTHHKIARLVVTGKHYYKNGEPNYSKLEKLIDKFLSTEYNNSTYEFILTPGGFLNFDFPISLQHDLDISEAEKQNVPQLQKEANLAIDEFFKSLDTLTLKKLKKTANYFTIGIDGSNPTNDQHIEFIAIYDLKKETVINWTGKFYPTERQKRNLIKVNDLDTHFMELNNQRIAILGCHDLNVFSPRGQAAANPVGWRRLLADKFKTKCKNFEPEIILHHPHTTDSPNVWNQAWRNIEKELPYVKNFASGIKFYNEDGVRGDIDKVLEKTKKGDVVDFHFD